MVVQLGSGSRFATGTNDGIRLVEPSESKPNRHPSVLSFDEQYPKQSQSQTTEVAGKRHKRRYSRRDGEATAVGKGVVLPLSYVGTSAFDATYTLPLLVGSGNQKLFVQLDTGSADLWFASSGCTDSSCPSERRSLSPGSTGNASAHDYKRLYHPLIPYPNSKGKSKDSESPTTDSLRFPLSRRGSSPLYDNTASTSFTGTGAPLVIQYLVGRVEGLIGWDRVGLDVGSDDNLDPDEWAVGYQAFVSATKLESEPLSSKFSGVMGLSPPSNSLIAQQIPPTNTDSPDGAPWSANIFGSNTELTERSWFISTLFDRPDGGVLSPPSPVLAVGTLPEDDAYPEFWTSDEGQSLVNVTFTRPMPSVDRTTGQIIGTTLWRVSVPRLEVQGKEVVIPSSMTAILDSGIPTILTSKTVADGIYGALGIGPGSDGNYYVSCNTALTFNISIHMNLGGGDMAFPLHPLDTAERRGNRNECMGTIQASAGIMENEMVLGIAFLRSVEVVWGFDGGVGLVGPGTGGNGGVKLGLRSLVAGDEAWDKAMEEWKTIRVDGLSLDGSSAPGNNSNDAKGGVSKVGVIALAVIGSLAVVCVGMFLLWRWLIRRREQQAYYESARRSPTAALFPGNERSSRFDDGKGPPPTETKSRWFGGLLFKSRSVDQDRTLRNGDYAMKDLEPSEDEKRRQRYEAYMSRQPGYRSSSYNSATDTAVGYQSGVLLADYGERPTSAHVVGEFGEKGKAHEKEKTLVGSDGTGGGNTLLYTGYGKEDPWDPATALDWGGRGGERDVLLSTDGHSPTTRTG